MNKEELLKKYCASPEEINFLNDYINSFAVTFRERYGKADLESLHSAFAPVFLDKIDHIKRKNGIGSDISEQLDEVESRFLMHKEVINIKFKDLFPVHLKVKLGDKDDNFLTSFTILKMNQSIFFVEHRLSISIKILQHFYSEKEEQIVQQKNFIELLNNLIQDFA
jgi:hypothetical protein